MFYRPKHSKHVVSVTVTWKDVRDFLTTLLVTMFIMTECGVLFFEGVI